MTESSHLIGLKPKYSSISFLFTRILLFVIAFVVNQIWNGKIDKFSNDVIIFLQKELGNYILTQSKQPDTVTQTVLQVIFGYSCYISGWHVLPGYHWNFDKFSSLYCIFIWCNVNLIMTIIHLSLRELSPFMVNDEIKIGICYCFYGMPSTAIVNTTLGTLLQVVYIEDSFNANKYNREKSTFISVKRTCVYALISIAKVESRLFIIATGFSSMVLGVSSLTSIVFGYLVTVILVSIFMMIKRVYEYDIKKSLIYARTSKRTQRKFIVMFISLYLFCFCFGSLWTTFIISKSITTKKREISKNFEISCPECMYRNKLDLDYMDAGYLDYIFLSVTVALSGFILALRSSERTNQQLSCKALLFRFIIKLFATVQFVIVLNIVFLYSYEQMWSYYGLYQSGLKAPALIISTIVYVLGPTGVFYLMDIDASYDYQFDKEDTEIIKTNTNKQYGSNFRSNLLKTNFYNQTISKNNLYKDVSSSDEDATTIRTVTKIQSRKKFKLNEHKTITEDSQQTGSRIIEAGTDPSHYRPSEFETLKVSIPNLKSKYKSEFTPDNKKQDEKEMLAFTTLFVEGNSPLDSKCKKTRSENYKLDVRDFLLRSNTINDLNRRLSQIEEDTEEYEFPKK